MPVEPLHVDLAGGRSLSLSPAAKGFPDVVRLQYDDGQTSKRVLADFKITSTQASRTLERELNVGPGEFAQLTSHYLEWSEAMVREMENGSEEELPPRPTPPYGLTQRSIKQPRSEAHHYDAVNSAGGILAVLKRTVDVPDTVIEWDKEMLPFLACLDLDFHDQETKEKPDDLELDRLGYALSPAPVCWWRSQGNGLKAIYTATPNDLFTAQELAVGAAAGLLTTISVLRGKGTVEIAARTRHPGSLQKGRACGPLVPSIPNEDFDVLARFSRSEATDAEVTEIMEAEGFEMGARLDHSYCLIDPQHPSTGTPIYVSPEGLFCHSCHARIGHGLMSWGYIRKRQGLGNESDRSLAPIRAAFENMVHSAHVDYLFSMLFPSLPEAFRVVLYRAQLKKVHGADPRVMQAFQPFHFVRGEGRWLHADTLLPVGKPLAAADVGVLPSCLRTNEEDGTFSAVQSSISAHTNNGHIPGWVPIQAYLFEPIYFVNNEDAGLADRVRCYPKRRTTRERVTYVDAKNRMPLARAEQLISDYFPGINMLYVKALIIAAGCAESGVSGVPMLWATGPTEAAKTTTIRVVTEMYGESFQNLSGAPEDRLDQLFGESMDKTRLLVFDDFAKKPIDYQRLHTFIIRLNRGGHTYHELYNGGVTPPLNNAIIFTDWRIPAFFSQDPQFGRRVHLLRLDNRLPVGWDKINRMAEGWWKNTPELTQAANALHSWIVDEFFPVGDTEGFSNKMARIGVLKLEDEAGSSDTQDAIKELVVELIERIASTPEEDAVTQRRVGRGARYIDWNKAGTVGPTCQLLVDSLGKGGGGSGHRDDDKVQTADNLKHVLDPFQLHLPKMYEFRDGIRSVEFEVRAWGSRSYVRIVEGGRSGRSKSKGVNADLFPSWPPQLREGVAVGAHEIPTPGAAEEPAALPVAAAAPIPETDEEPIVIEDAESSDPFVVFLDFESQSACDLRKHGAYVYSQHPSTKTMCAALVADGRRIFWTLDRYDLVMPAGMEYEHGIDFLRDMVTDPRGCIIVAHNTGFERPMWVYNLKLPEPLAWRDTMDRTLAMGLPAGADEAGVHVLGMGKDLEGQAFIRKIWGPNKKTGELPLLTSAVIQKIINYNFRDTDISIGIAKKFGLDAVPAWEQHVCDLHHKINHWGVCIDGSFAQTLRDLDSEFKAIAGDYVEKITLDDTGVSAITRADLTRNDFLRAQLNLNLPQRLQLANMQMSSLEKIVDLYDQQQEAKTSADDESGDISHVVVEVIKCRLTVTRAALAKVEKALGCISADGRAKAQLRYHGAATGRWSSYQVQIQNMKRPSEDFDLPSAITAVETRDHDGFMRLCKDQPPYELLGSLVRGILVPAQGNVFVVGDFASVEARGVLWLAGDEEGLLEYRRKDEADERHPDGKDPSVPDTYQTLAGTIFNKSPLEVSKKERGGGKIGILAAGFGGGPNAVIRMAAPLGIDLAALGLDPQAIVDGYRTKYHKVKSVWYEVERAFRTVLVSNRTTTQKVGRLTFTKYPDRIELVLPSGRPITYMNARLETDPFDASRQTITYDNAVRGKVLNRRTYSGKIYENAVQGFCRDLLADVMLRVDAAGAPIAFHVHDEVVLEVPEAHAEQWREWLQATMRIAPSWAPGMPVFSRPEIMRRYGK